MHALTQQRRSRPAQDHCERLGPRSGRWQVAQLHHHERDSFALVFDGERARGVAGKVAAGQSVEHRWNSVVAGGPHYRAGSSGTESQP
jgi:hypothetical protein